MIPRRVDAGGASRLSSDLDWEHLAVQNEHAAGRLSLGKVEWSQTHQTS